MVLERRLLVTVRGSLKRTKSPWERIGAARAHRGTITPWFLYPLPPHTAATAIMTWLLSLKCFLMVYQEMETHKPSSRLRVFTEAVPDGRFKSQAILWRHHLTVVQGQPKGHSKTLCPLRHPQKDCQESYLKRSAYRRQVFRSKPWRCYCGSQFAADVKSHLWSDPLCGETTILKRMG